ncbi:tyrosine-type recombinase/integrase [Mycolicibacterium elephantis]|uniref:tyrosine-type recombinase/integrase n=1 Tax=Mycolicibacterium elephantis TaxID=81858 RepID=UPI0007EAF802|nr:site-specific integrase [Mycolicibacterium elephantis]OBB22126.1 integrase [Mycolicibacterium elephantis]
MASIRVRPRKDGTTTYAVLYTLNGRQSSLPFDDRAAAEKFRALIDNVGAARALEIHGIDPAPRRRRAEHDDSMTVAQWLTHHIDHLTGVDKRTRDDYRGYVRNAPALGAIPLRALSSDDVARWVQGMEDDGVSGKTIANKHGFLSGALAAAVKKGHIPANPAAGARLPRTERDEMVFLTREQFTVLYDEVPEAWQPLVRFLVASGARWGEVTALKPGDVDRSAGTVRITRAWRKNPYRIAPPKTKRSVRTINVPTAVLDALDYTGEWLFTNPGRGRRAQGGPVRAPNFRANVWWPACQRAELDPRPRIHDMRHTCASWMIAAGVPLPVIQAHLGHESIATTVNLYGHLDRRSHQAAADAIAGMLS